MTSRHAQCMMEGSPTTGPMTDATRTALLALGAALAADPAAQRELACYGDLPLHLADAIDDAEPEADDE